MMRIGSPFQREVAFANLAFGVLGLLSFKMRESFRLAAIIGYSLFLLGAAYGHIQEMTTKGNYAEYNAGSVLYIDILISVILIILWIAHCQLRNGSDRLDDQKALQGHRSAIS